MSPSAAELPKRLVLVVGITLGLVTGRPTCSLLVDSTSDSADRPMVPHSTQRVQSQVGIQLTSAT